MVLPTHLELAMLEYIQQGLGGIIPSVLSVVIIATEADPQSTGLYGFVFVTAAEVACLAIIYAMQANEFYRHHTDQEHNNQPSFSGLSLAWIFSHSIV